MPRKRLNPSQVARLGGLAVSRDKLHMSRLGDKGGQVVKERYGKDFFVRLAYRRHGYKVDLPKARETKS